MDAPALNLWTPSPECTRLAGLGLPDDEGATWGRGVSKAALRRVLKGASLNMQFFIGSGYWLMDVYPRERKTQLDTSANVDRILNLKATQKSFTR